MLFFYLTALCLLGTCTSAVINHPPPPILPTNSSFSPPTEGYWYSRLPNTPLPKPLQDILQPGCYPSVSRKFASQNVSIKFDREKYGKFYNVRKRMNVKNSVLPRTTVYYFYNSLHPGKKMKLLFTNAGTKVGFLPDKVAESIPFSSDKLPEIFLYLGIDTNSKEANIMRNEIEECEDPNMDGEDKYCATSLDSLIKFNVEKLGEDVWVLSTDQGKEQEYSVSAKVKKINGNRVVVCHKITYPYAVHYCHVIKDTEVFVVPLVGADGEKLKAFTVCHKNTSAWSPEHLAFKILKTKPGPAVCHFLSSDTLIWVPKSHHDMTP